MTSFLPNDKTEQTALSGTSVQPNANGDLCTGTPSGMTGIQEIQDDIFGLEAQLHGKRTAKLLAYRYPNHNFTTQRTPSKPVHVATGRNASV